MAGPSLRMEEDLALLDHFELFNQSYESTERYNTPISYSTPKKPVQPRPQLTVNVVSGAATFQDQGSIKRDEVIDHLTSQLTALSRRVDELVQKQMSSLVVIDSGTWSTPTVRSWEYPELETVGRVKSSNGFHRAQGLVKFSKEFKTAPTVRVSLSAADVSKDADFRVKVYATGVDMAGFIAHVDTWGDSRVYSCEISWVAIGC